MNLIIGLVVSWEEEKVVASKFARSLLWKKQRLFFILKSSQSIFLLSVVVFVRCFIAPFSVSWGHLFMFPSINDDLPQTSSLFLNKPSRYHAKFQRIVC
mmetsp:Transcript_47462/g.122873  ORF Transcript_47462/g.122873 Transcript_47462/m.122873 type:complete len:99 (-) Transcript_47462:149-445(-)